LTTPRLRVPRHVARLVMRLVAPLVVDYFAYGVCPGASACRVARCRLLRLRRASGCLGTLHGSSLTTSPTPCVLVPQHVARLIARLVAPLVVDYFAYAARPGASARRAACRRLLPLRRASGCLGTSCGSSHDYFDYAAHPVPRHIARFVTRLVAPLVVDYFAYAVCPGASARRAARCRLFCLRRASGCLGTSRGSSSTSSLMPRVRVPRHVARLITPLVVNYFAYTTHPGASAHRADRRAARRQLLRLAQARRRLLRLRCASGCLVTLHGSSRRSSSSTSPTPCILVPRHVACLVTWLVVDYSVHHDFRLTATLAQLQPCRASRLLASRQH
jgi:hypothetical protein